MFVGLSYYVCRAVVLRQPLLYEISGCCNTTALQVYFNVSMMFSMLIPSASAV